MISLDLTIDKMPDAKVADGTIIHDISCGRSYIAMNGRWEQYKEKNSMEPIEHELIDKLAQSISAMASNQIPIEQRLWSADDCAQYLRMDKKTFQNYYAPHPRFPKSIKLERAGGRSNPLWKAGEVIEWAMTKNK